MGSNTLTSVLDAFDKITSKEVENILECLNQKLNSEFRIFDGPIVVDDGNRPASLKGRHGVYLFILTEDIHITSDQIKGWNSIKGAGLKHEINKDFARGKCLYLGSCTTNSLYVRFREHYSSKGTFTALYLNNENRSFLRNKVQVYLFPLRKEYEIKKYRRLILTSVEKKLHEKLNPMAGGSKV